MPATNREVFEQIVKGLFPRLEAGMPEPLTLRQIAPLALGRGMVPTPQRSAGASTSTPTTSDGSRAAKGRSSRSDGCDRSRFP